MSALDKVWRRFLIESGRSPADVADLLNVAIAAELAARQAETAAELRARQAEAELSESRRQVTFLMREREAARDIVSQAQSVVMSGLSGLLTDLSGADRDIYISVLAGAGVEITHQHRNAADRTDELTFVGQTIGEAVALCRAHLQETT